MTMGPTRFCPLIVIGASQGGMAALQTLLGKLPGDCPAVAVVLHRDRNSERFLSQLIGSKSALPVEEVTDKLPYASGHVYLAPADYHVLIEEGHFALSTDPPVRWSRPSIDLLFETAADACGPGVIGVVLTGANEDGACGAARIVARGGMVAVQDPASAECETMPRAVIAATGTPHILPLGQIAAWLTRQVAKQTPVHFP